MTQMGEKEEEEQKGTCFGFDYFFIIENRTSECMYY